MKNWMPISGIFWNNTKRKYQFFFGNKFCISNSIDFLLNVWYYNKN